MNFSFFIVSCISNASNKLKYELPLSISFKKYKQSTCGCIYILNLIILMKESQILFFSHDLPFLEREAFQNCQNN